MKKSIIETIPEDDEVLERLSIQDEGLPAPTYIEFAPTFLAVEDPQVKSLINELLPESVIALAHGEPRTRKTWFAMEVCLALATGTPAFGLERFAVTEPRRVLYSSQEDSSRHVRERFKRALRGRAVDPVLTSSEGQFPSTLAFSVHKGIDLENPVWQENLLRDVKAYAFGLVVFDPIRRFSLNVDKGPAEVRNVTAFLRRLCIETGASVLIIHHDVKPSAQGPDSRRRGQRASGGDWFAASECPIAFEPAGDRTLVIPEDYKFSQDPEGFTFAIEEDPEKTWARLLGESANAEQVQDIAIQDKVLTYLVEHSGSSTVAVAKGCKIRKEDVADALTKLTQVGKADCTVGGPGKATRWFIKEQKA